MKVDAIFCFLLFYRQRRTYFKDGYNYLECLSSLLIICVIPLRIYDYEAQWVVFAVGYIVWTFRSFKYLTVIGMQVFSFKFSCFRIYYIRYIEDICFFEVNTKYISSSELKTSELSRVHSTSENVYVFNTRDEMYLVFTENRQIFFLFCTMHGHFAIHKTGGENAKTKHF